MNIYVGNLDFRMKEDELRKTFEEFGEVSSARIISDKYSGRSKGFGFVEMPEQEEAKQAIEVLNGKEFGGRKLTVNESIEKTERKPSFNRGERGGRDNNFRRGGRDRDRDRY